MKHLSHFLLTHSGTLTAGVISLGSPILHTFSLGGQLMLLEDWLLPQETHVFADVCNVDHQNKAGAPTPIMLAASLPWKQRRTCKLWKSSSPVGMNAKNPAR